MEIENNLTTNFELLKNIPEGEFFKKPDSNEIFIKTSNTKLLSNEHVWETQYCCVGISKGDIEYISNVKVIPISGKFVVNPDSQHYWTISASDGEINTIPYNQDISNISNIATEYHSEVTTNVSDGEFVKYDVKSGQLVSHEAKSSDQ